MFRRRRAARDEARDEVEEFVGGLDPDRPKRARRATDEAAGGRIDPAEPGDVQEDRDDLDDEVADDEDDFEDATGDDTEEGDLDETAARQGPWDVEEAPEDDVARLDLGAVRVPTFADVEVRLEADPQGQVTAVLLLHGGSVLQLGVFAAPRTEGIWDEVREEIAAGIADGGGRTDEREGEYGTELWAQVATDDGIQPLRFVGVDGPRWFLRAVYTGTAATDPDADPVLAESVRAAVVVRGSEPMPVRDPLPLHLPREVIEEQAAQAAGQGRRVAPPRRGPEITEVR